MNVVEVNGVKFVVTIDNGIVSAVNDELNISYLDKFSDISGVTSKDVIGAKFKDYDYSILCVYFGDENGCERYCPIGYKEMYMYELASVRFREDSVAYNGKVPRNAVKKIKDHKISALRNADTNTKKLIAYIQHITIEKLQKEISELKKQFLQPGS